MENLNLTPDSQLPQSQSASNKTRPGKYWFSYRSNFGNPRGLPIPIARQGWYAIGIYILVFVVAAFIFLPLKGNPTKSQLTPFIIICALDILAYLIIGKIKTEPKP